MSAPPRTHVPELMDEPGFDPAQMSRTLRALKHMNRLSRVWRTMWRPIKRWLRRSGVKRLTLLDIACGGADVPIGLVRAARRRQVNVHLILLDRSESGLAHASAMARQQGVAPRIVRADVTEPWPALRADVVTSTLFLHHLREPQAVVRVLRQMREAAVRLVIVNDLRRSRFGWALAWVVCRVVTRNPVVHHDGPASVRSAWTIAEMRQMAHQAGLEGAQVRAVWPWRMQLVWENHHGAA